MKALNIAPQNFTIWIHVGFLKYLVSEIDEAIGHYHKVRLYMNLKPVP
jgi:hypothetical protein